MGLELHHSPVMVPEVLDALKVQPGGRYIDATMGEGGHTQAILSASQPGGQVLGIDADHEAVAVARNRLDIYRDAVRIELGNFRDLRQIALSCRAVPVHGVLMDLGVSSLQLNAETRGFSFRRPDPLDMRFSLEQQVTAGDIVNSYRQEDLANLIYRFGEERQSRSIAAAIVKARPFQNSLELATTVASATRGRRGRLRPATRTFQALRIAVNDELGALESALGQAVSLLGLGGRLVVMSYHSLEDRIVKNFMRRESVDCICPPATPGCLCAHLATIRQDTKRAIQSPASEVQKNRRSRSARLRWAERI